MVDTSGMDEVMQSFLVHNYSCDEWAGYTEKAFTEKDFPLTHFAVLPEGIVLTYHLIRLIVLLQANTMLLSPSRMLISVWYMIIPSMRI